MLPLSQRPLSGSAADAELFVDRERELARLHRAVGLGFNTLVLGERGVGVTSLVNQLHARLEDAGTPALYVNAARVDTVGELVERLEASLRTRHVDDAVAIGQGFRAGVGDDGSVGSRLLEALVAGRPARGDLQAAEGVAGFRLHGRSQQRIAGRSPAVVLIIDEAYSPATVHGLFGRLRDELWELPVTWVVCGDRRYRKGYLEPPADAFFDDVLEIGPLDDEGAANLLLRRLDHAGGSDSSDAVRLRPRVALLVEAAQGNPRRLLASARQLILTPPEDAEHRLQAASRLHAAAGGLGRAPAMLASELEALGPSSASDPQLLDRLGWTRARAAQVLRQLEEAGIVTAAPARDPERSGRPRKLYQLDYNAFAGDDEEPAR